MRLALAALAVLLALRLPGQEPAAQENADDAVREALHLSFKGQALSLSRLAQTRLEEERNAEKEGRDVICLSDNIAALAGATARPVAAEDETRNIISRFSGDGETEAYFRLLEQTSPIEQWRLARKARRYGAIHRRVNSVTNAVSGLLRLQFFALAQVPLDIVEDMTVMRNYLTPEQRRELAAARSVKSNAMEDERVDRTIIALMPRRTRLAALQAKRNGEAAEERGDLHTADWWYGREMLLRRSNEESPDHVAVQKAISQNNERRSLSVTVPSAEEFDIEGQREDYATLLRVFISKPDNPETFMKAQDYALRYRGLAGADEAHLIKGLYDQERGEDRLARMQFDRIGREESGWSRRMERFLLRPQFNPKDAFSDARASVRRTKWNFVISGITPQAHPRHLTAEGARQKEANWIRRARSLFILDSAARGLFLPFIPASFFPRDQVFDTAALAPDDYKNSDNGQNDMASVARHYKAAQRYNDAAEIYEELDEYEKARKMRRKEFQRQFKQARKITSPSAREEALEKILNEFPNAPRAHRVQEELERTKREAAVLVALTRKQLRAHPKITGEAGINFPAVLLDGEKSNGEVSAIGVRILRGGQIQYKDGRSGSVVSLPLDDDALERVMRMAYSLGRSDELRDVLRTPPEVRRIPLQIEGSALPGFDISPGLVPPESNFRKRQLFE